MGGKYCHVANSAKVAQTAPVTTQCKCQRKRQSNQDGENSDNGDDDRRQSNANMPRMARCGRACISLERTASHVTSSSHCVTPQPSSDTATCKERKARVCGQRRAPQRQSPLRRHRCRSTGRAALFKNLRRLFHVAAAHSSFLRQCHFPTVTLSGKPQCFGFYVRSCRNEFNTTPGWGGCGLRCLDWHEP